MSDSVDSEWKESQGSKEFCSNPFATRYTRPGAIPWFGSETPTELAERFLAGTTHSSIVGPHGSGKSTLLAHMAPLLGESKLRIGAEDSLEDLSRQESPEFAGNIIWMQLRRLSGNSDPNLHCPWKSIQYSRRYWRDGDILILDGFEQLGLAERLKCLWLARKQNVRLLVTSHRSHWGVETLYQSHVDRQLAKQIVGHLLTNRADTEAMNDFQGKACQIIDSSEENMREALMELFDHFRDSHSKCHPE